MFEVLVLVPASAQTTNASMSGTVLDPQGLVVPDTRIAAISDVDIAHVEHRRLDPEAGEQARQQ